MTDLFLCCWNSGGSLKGVAGGLYTDVMTMFPRSTERVSILFWSSVCIDSTVVPSFTKIAFHTDHVEIHQCKSFHSFWACCFVVSDGFRVIKEHCIYA